VSVNPFYLLLCGLAIGLAGVQLAKGNDGWFLFNMALAAMAGWCTAESARATR
jgi:hypothetical protein